jgi:hypothetical protein
MMAPLIYNCAVRVPCRVPDGRGEVVSASFVRPSNVVQAQESDPSDHPLRATLMLIERKDDILIAVLPVADTVAAQ